MRKKKELDGFVLSIIIIFSLIIIFSGLFYLDGSITGLAVFTTLNQSDFDDGNFSSTFFNETSVAVELNTTDNLSGNYTSQVFNVSGGANWTTISWVSSQIGELPSNVQNDTFTEPVTDMSANVLLIHFNNDTSVGENTTHVYDYSGNGNNGTWGSGQSNGTAKLGAYSGYFDNSKSHINVSDANLLDFGSTTDFTISTWIKRSSVNSQDFIIDKRTADNGGILFYADNTGKIQLQVNSVDTLSDSTIVANKWYHVVGVADRDGNSQIYINGIANGTASDISSAGNVDNANLLRIGARSFSTILNNFDGNIDEVGIWRRALSVTEIVDLYKRGLTRLNLTVQSCDDELCSGDSFIDVNDSSPQNLSLSTNRFFRYQFEFETDDGNYTAGLYNVTIQTEGDENPNVTNLVPTAEIIFNATDTITFSADVEDSYNVSQVFGNVTLPNGTIDQQTLINVGGNTFNVSYTLPNLGGEYILIIEANDTLNNFNGSENTTFTVDYNFSFILDKTSVGLTSTSQHGFTNGTLNNVTFNGTYFTLNQTFENGSFTSQIFNGGQTVNWNNISWITGVTGELPNNQTVETTFEESNINMTNNILLLHLNNNAVGESSTHAYDFSGKENNGTIESTETSTIGVFETNDKKFGDASINFTGEPYWINMSQGPVILGADPFTVSVWINTENSSRQEIMEQRKTLGAGIFTAYILVVNESGTINFRTWNNTVGKWAPNATGTKIISDGEWHHIVAVRNESGTLSIYVDGSLDGSDDGDIVEFGSEDVMIGANVRDNNNFFDGLMDEFAIWNRTLSSSEIVDLYKRGATELDLKVKSCDDIFCVGEDFTDVDDTSEQNLTINDNQYFQYRFNLRTANNSYSPQLYNVTVGYDLDLTPSASPEEVSIGSSDSTGGGGGGSLSNARSHVEQFELVENNTLVTVNIPSIRGLEKVVFTVTKNLEKEWLLVEEIIVVPEFKGDWYQLFEIKGGKIKKYLQEADIYYSIERDWLRSQELDRYSVGLFVWDGDSWEELSTRLRAGDSDYFNYVGTTNRFDYFVIGVKERVDEIPPLENVLSAESVGVVVRDSEKDVELTETPNSFLYKFNPSVTKFIEKVGSLFREYWVPATILFGLVVIGLFYFMIGKKLCFPKKRGKKRI